MESVIGYFAAGLIGVSLGMMGGGGSILTVPVLVYLFHFEPALATAYSLFIVGTTSLVGGVQSAMKRHVDFRAAVVFAVPSFVAVYLTRRFLLPLVPDELFTIFSWSVTRDGAIMVLFAIIMLAAAVSMLRNAQHVAQEQSKPFRYRLIVVEGLVVGAITGVVGAGGGFLIIPALVLFAGLPMKKAIGTSLVVIAAKSLVGFVGDIHAGQPINLGFALLISAVAIAGIFVGRRLAEVTDGSKLKKGFGWFVLAMGVWVIAAEVIY